MREIELNDGYRTVIDDEDYEIVVNHRWRVAKKRDGRIYAWASIRGHDVYLHRLLLGAKSGEYGDHLDGDGLNNQRSNIRLATATQNAANRRKTQRARKSSRFKGVYWWRHAALRSGGYWKAQLVVQGRVRVKYAKTEDTAARLYNEMAREAFGPFARLNGVS